VAEKRVGRFFRRVREKNLPILPDGNPKTIVGRASQQVGDALIVGMGVPVRACAVLLSLGDFAFAFPRRLSVATSLDAQQWTTGPNVPVHFTELAVRAR